MNQEIEPRSEQTINKLRKRYLVQKALAIASLAIAGVGATLMVKGVAAESRPDRNITINTVDTLATFSGLVSGVLLIAQSDTNEETLNYYETIRQLREDSL